MPIQSYVVDKEYHPAGLKDGGHIFISCSNCNAYLMDIWRTRPHEKEVWKVVATCPFCGDKSFEQKIQGGFYPGGYGLPKEDDEDDDFPVTIIDVPEINGDTFLFKMKKAREDAKPVYRHQ